MKHQDKLRNLEKTWDRMSKEAKPPTKKQRNKLFSWPEKWTPKEGYLERSDVEHERRHDK
jgi:hypothetical protein